MKNRIIKFMNSLRFKSGKTYNFKGKGFYRSQFKKVLICIVIILIILLLKTINSEPTNKAIRIIENTINKTMNFKEDGQKILAYLKKVKVVPDNFVSVFNGNQQERSDTSYIPPIKGKVYKTFGIEEKGNGIKVFHKGIDILAYEKEVVAIQDGVIIEVGNNNIVGNYVIIQHGEISSIYGYLDGIHVKIEENIRQGDEIGILEEDNNGRNMLHFELWKEDSPIDPLTYIDFPLVDAVLR